MTGRPSVYSDELLDAICARLSEGEPLAEICRDPEINVASRTVREWTNKMENVKEAIAQARILGYDAISEETLAIADGKLPDAEGKRDPTRDKLRVDTRFKRRWCQILWRCCAQTHLLQTTTKSLPLPHRERVRTVACCRLRN